MLFTTSIKLFPNRIPFPDIRAICDPSSPDVTGRTLEALGLISQTANRVEIREDILERAKASSEQAIRYLITTHEPIGAALDLVGGAANMSTPQATCYAAWRINTISVHRSKLRLILRYSC